MRKQIKQIIKSLLITNVVVISSFGSTILLMTEIMATKALAAPAKCYQITGTGDQRQATLMACPAPNSGAGGLGATTYTDGGPKDTDPATCYEYYVTGGLGGVQLTPKDCVVILAPNAKCYTSEYASMSSCPPIGFYGITYSDGGPSGSKCYVQGTGNRIAIMSPMNCATVTAIGNCLSSGGEWKAFQSSQPGAVDGQVYRCDCPSGERLDQQRCVNSETSSPSSTTDNSIPVADGPVVDCDEETADLTAENCKIIGLLNTVFNFVSGGVALAVIGNIIYAGIQYSMAQGDPSGAAKAKSRIRTALLAFLMYLSLYAFIQWLIPGGVF